MTDELHVVIDPDDPMFVTINGRRLARIMGGDGTEEVTPESEAAEPGTEPESAPPEGTRAEESDTDWEKRYKDLQSTYTKTSQEAAELREWRQAQEAERAHVDALADPDTQEAAIQSLTQQLGEDGAREWLEAHGFELEDDDEDDGPQEYRDPRLDKFLEEHEERELAGRVQEVETQLNAKLDEMAADKKLDLDVKVGEGDDQLTLRDLILDHAAVHAGPDELPDVERAFNLLLGFQDSVVKGYRQTKRPSTPPVKGGPGTPASPLGDQKSRLELANQIAEEAAQSS